MTINYYQKKEKLRKEARERHQNLSEEEKEKRQKNAQGRYENLSEEENEKKIAIIIVNVIRIFLRNKSKSKLSI